MMLYYSWTVPSFVLKWMLFQDDIMHIFSYLITRWILFWTYVLNFVDLNHTSMPISLSILPHKSYLDWILFNLKIIFKSIYLNNSSHLNLYSQKNDSEDFYLNPEENSLDENEDFYLNPEENPTNENPTNENPTNENPSDENPSPTGTNLITWIKMQILWINLFLIAIRNKLKEILGIKNLFQNLEINKLKEKESKNFQELQKIINLLKKSGIFDNPKFWHRLYEIINDGEAFFNIKEKTVFYENYFLDSENYYRYSATIKVFICVFILGIFFYRNQISDWMGIKIPNEILTSYVSINGTKIFSFSNFITWSKLIIHFIYFLEKYRENDTLIYYLVKLIEGFVCDLCAPDLSVEERLTRLKQYIDVCICIYEMYFPVLLDTITNESMTLLDRLLKPIIQWIRRKLK